jgi:hypothetical protein
MTANYLLDAMFELRKYLWQEMVDNNILDPENYYSDAIGETISPILPVQQSPEMNHFFSGKTHLVYDKIGMSYEDNWLICCEQILFTIYSTDVLEINKIRNFMTDLFRRMDDSAKDINRYPEKSNKIKFHSIFIADISPTAPSEEMQGFFSTDITLEIKYSRITDSVGRFL